MPKPYHEDEQKALAKAFQYLLRRDHSRKEIERKLRNKGFSSSAIAGAIEELIATEYLDDKEFGKTLVRHGQVYRRLGPFAIRALLAEKGITGELVDMALEEYSPELEEENLTAIIEGLQRAGKDYKKIFAHLHRKGYSSGSIRKAMRELASGSESNQEVSEDGDCEEVDPGIVENFGERSAPGENISDDLDDCDEEDGFF